MLETNERLMREMTRAFYALLAQELKEVFKSKRSRRTGPLKLDSKPMKLRFSICLDKKE